MAAAAGVRPVGRAVSEVAELETAVREVASVVVATMVAGAVGA